MKHVPVPAITLISLLALGGVNAGGSVAQQYNPADPIPPDAEVTTGTLANGLTCFIHENDEPENRAELRLVTRHDNGTLSDLQIRTLEKGLPSLRGNVSLNQAFPGATRALVRASYWGGYFDAQTPYYESDARNTIDYPGRVLVDAEVAQTLMDRWTLTLGAQNALNTDPEEYPGTVTGPGNRYGPLTPFGFNGAFFYTRLTYNW